MEKKKKQKVPEKGFKEEKRRYKAKIKEQAKEIRSLHRQIEDLKKQQGIDEPKKKKEQKKKISAKEALLEKLKKEYIKDDS